MKKRFVLTEMPDRETLEEFLRPYDIENPRMVFFDKRLGKLVWWKPKKIEETASAGKLQK